MADQVARSPKFFANAPVVLDLTDSRASPKPPISSTEAAAARASSSMPVGVQNGDLEQQRAACAAGLGAFAGPRVEAPQAAPTGPRAAAPRVKPTPRHEDRCW